MDDQRQSVFVSYSFDDSRVAELLADALRQAGREPWLASERLKPGDDLYGSVAKAIDRAGAVVLIIPAGRPSEWLLREWELAIRARWNRGETRLLPVLMPGATIPSFLAGRGGVPLPSDERDWRPMMQSVARMAEYVLPPDVPVNRTGGPRRLQALGRDAAALAAPVSNEGDKS